MNYLAPLLGWVLLQAAWQTLAVALLLLLCLRLMRGSSAAARYRCASWCLAAALGAVALTFLVSHASVAAGLDAAACRLPGEWRRGVPDRSLPLLRAAAWIWLAGIAGAHLLLALHWIRLRRFLRASAPGDPALAGLVGDLARDIGLARMPEVRCAPVSSPMVAGSRPAILVTPLAFRENYPAAEARALLLHELAHIQRGDYCANLRHLWAASLLWWHPAAWLIYARIRHERECSSDERAVRFTGSSIPLAHALLRLADHFAGPAAIAAWSGGLCDRIARLAGSSAGRPEAMPRLLTAALAALACLAAAAGSAASHRDALTRAYAASAAGPSTPITIHAHDPAGAFQVRMVRGRVTAIDFEDVRVPAGQVLQSGDTVRVVGKSGEELLRLEIDPRGGLRWQARRAS